MIEETIAEFISRWFDTMKFTRKRICYLEWWLIAFLKILATIPILIIFPIAIILSNLSTYRDPEMDYDYKFLSQFLSDEDVAGILIARKYQNKEEEIDA